MYTRLWVIRRQGPCHLWRRLPGPCTVSAQYYSLKGRFRGKHRLHILCVLTQFESFLLILQRRGQQPPSWSGRVPRRPHTIIICRHFITLFSTGVEAGVYPIPHRLAEEISCWCFLSGEDKHFTTQLNRFLQLLAWQENWDTGFRGPHFTDEEDEAQTCFPRHPDRVFFWIWPRENLPQSISRAVSAQQHNPGWGEYATLASFWCLLMSSVKHRG